MRKTGWSNVVDDSDLFGLFHREGDDLYFIGRELGFEPYSNSIGQGVLMLVTPVEKREEFQRDQESESAGLDWETASLIVEKLAIYTQIRAEGVKPMVDVSYAYMATEKKLVRLGGISKDD